MTKLKITIIIGFLSLFLLSGCSLDAATDDRLEKLKQASSGVVQAASTHFDHSITDAGIFYIGYIRGNIKWTTLRYYDYEADENFVLCSSSNCEHDSADCPAYMGDYYWIYGFACYEGKLYYLLQENYDSPKMEFVSMDVDGTNRKVLAELEVGDYSVGSWVLDNVMTVYYVNGKAIMFLDYHKVTEDGPLKEEDQGTQIIMVELSDGSIQEVTGHPQENADAIGIGHSMVTEKYLIYNISNMKEPYLEEEVFYETYGEEASYEDYLTEYYETTRRYTTDWCVDLDTGEITELQTVEVIYPYSPYIELGTYEDKILYQKLTGTEEQMETVELYLLDPKTGETTQTIPFTEELTNIPGSICSYKGGYMYDEGQIRVYYSDEDTYRLYIYSLADGSLKQIRDQEKVDEYFVGGATEKRILLYEDASNDLFWLTREDYEAGNFDKATKINLEYE